MRTLKRLRAHALADLAKAATRMRPPLAAVKADVFEFKPVEKVRKGEWLYAVPERGQTFSEFHRLEPPRINQKRSSILVVPMAPPGTRAPRQVKAVAAFLRAFFDCRVCASRRVLLDDSLYNPRRRQYDADAVLDLLGAQVPSDAIAVLGVTGEHLSRGRLRDVAGISALKGRAAVISLARCGRKGQRKSDAIRIAKNAAHELGHAVGMEHCPYFRCLMNGANSVKESDRIPLSLCPVCLAKVEWAFRLDLSKHCRRLKSYYTRSGWRRAAAFQKRLLSSLNSHV